MLRIRAPPPHSTHPQQLTLCRNPYTQVDGAGEHVAAGIRPSELDERQMEDLIAENLLAQLQILPEQDLGAALHNFVDKVRTFSLSTYFHQPFCFFPSHGRDLSPSLGSCNHT